MSMTNSPDNQNTSLGRDLLYAARYYLGGRRVLLALAAIALVAGLALNWSWLVAAGFAPLLLGVLPCAAMCALGLCLNKMGSKSCSTDAASDKAAALPDETRSSAALERRPITPLGSPAEVARPEAVAPAGREPQALEDRKKTDG